MTPSIARALASCGALLLASDVANAAHVVAMREGERTVVSVQPDYDGPLEAFTLEVPVDDSFRKENVRTLPRAVFTRIDRIDAPRLVELREADPCGRRPAVPDAAAEPAAEPAASAPTGVRADAAFAVGEYTFALVRAKGGAATKMLVVHVDPSRVPADRGLSPLRFHFDDPSFRVPLGAIVAGSTKDVILHVLGRSRYEAADRVNVTIPTNLDVVPRTIDRFASFCAALFDRTIATHARAVVTEYAMDGAPVAYADLLTLGADVLPSVSSEREMVDPQILRALGGDGGSGRKYYGVRSFTLTRLHLPAAEVRSDLVLTPTQIGNFEARYTIRNRWSGPVDCDAPAHGLWLEESSRPALDVPSAPRDVGLASLVADDGPAIGPPPDDPPPAPSKKGGCSGCALGAPLAAVLLAARARRRARR